MTQSHEPSSSGESTRKTLAIRLEADQHAQLTLIAQLEELTVTDAIRQAIDNWIDARRSNPQLQERAQAVLDDIERDAATKRGALAALLGGENEEKSSARSRRKPPLGFSPSGPQARATGEESPTG